MVRRGMNGAAKRFRHVDGHLHRPARRAALDRHAEIAVTSTSDTDHAAA
jgi:hypothetical protein